MASKMATKMLDIGVSKGKLFYDDLPTGWFGEGGGKHLCTARGKGSEGQGGMEGLGKSDEAHEGLGRLRRARELASPTFRGGHFSRWATKM